MNNNTIKETAAAVLAEYRTNEYNNFHTENLLLLAQNFGTDAEIELVEGVPGDYLISPNIKRQINSYFSTLVTLAK